ncbi:MAG: metallophosphoesterase family protein [Candidatus Eisenbacteria bacterium]|nr:metallophosphoesterase family protein [Candidatus Eisenbacteria bacterium]
MLHAILSDIHGNIDALDTTLADIAARGAGTLVCLGDFVGYGAAPNECIDRVRATLEAAVAGNHDMAACGRIKLGYFNPDAAKAATWTTDTLTPENVQYLRDLPMSVLWRGVRLVHSSPAEPEEWHYVLSPGDAAFEMESCAESVCFVGHSHYPGTFELDGELVTYSREPRVLGRAGRRYLVNVPSVGQPRDGDRRAGYLLFDDERFTFEHVRLEYDIPAAMKRIRDAGLPPFLAERLQWGE